MHVALLNTRVRILSFPKALLPIWSHDIQRLMQPPTSPRNHVTPEPFFAFTENSVECCIVASAAAFDQGFAVPKKARFPHLPGKPYMLTRDIYYVMQVQTDDEDDYGNRPLLEMSENMANAEIPIMYISTFQTDFLLLKQRDLNKAYQIWTQLNYTVYGLDILALWDDPEPPPMPSQSQAIPQAVSSGDANCTDGYNVALTTDVHPQASQQDTSLPDPASPTDSSLVLGDKVQPDGSSSSPLTLDVIEHHVRQIDFTYQRRNEWLQTLIFALLYPDLVGMALGMQRFVSYVAAEDEVSLTANPCLLKSFGRDHVNSSMESNLYQLFEIHYRNTLRRVGLVFDLAQRIDQRHLELMYITTYHTACLMVKDQCVDIAREIVGSYALLPDNVDDDNSDEYETVSE
ncbi:hypothetical protein IWQ62_002825 [Dispira parvispora]|uniref:CASTOR ACT domain-containing protein n=1 Tax=Dispira parvispora TaxID=1520584 RepID=A0A9W8E3G7_9FUNG|nr:hypothetical protein IWQ62_002825 [Dispira parvispora]